MKPGNEPDSRENFYPVWKRSMNYGNQWIRGEISIPGSAFPIDQVIIPVKRRDIVLDLSVCPSATLFIIPREAKGYSFGLVGLSALASVRPSVTLFFYFVRL